MRGEKRLRTCDLERKKKEKKSNICYIEKMHKA